MKLNAEQLEIAKKCSSAGELVEKARLAGLEISQEQAQKCFESVQMTELSEEDLSLVSGGCSSSGTRCEDCGQLCGQYVYHMMTDTGEIVLCKSCADKRGFKK